MWLSSAGSRLSLCGILLVSLVCCDLDAAALDGRVFVLQSAEGFRPVADTMPRLAFQHGQLSLNAGCNTIFGSFELRDSRLITSELATTEIGCDSVRQSQDEWLQSFLSAEPLCTLTSDRLTLESSLAKLVFVNREVAEPDQELVDTVWSVDTFLEGDGASNFFLQPEPTVVFAADQSIRIDTTCNTATGRYSVGKDQLTVSNVMFSSHPCSGPAKSADAHLRSLFRAGTLSFEIAAGRLTLGTRALGISASAGDADAGADTP